MRYKVSNLDGIYEGKDLKDVMEQLRKKQAHFVELDGQLEIYVDGSFVDGECYAGFIVYAAGEEIHREHGKVKNLFDEDGNLIKDYLSSRNVAGECKAAMMAIAWAKKNRFNNILICHDYEGVGKWARGEWRKNKDISVDYVAFLEKYKNDVVVEFKWVKGHGNDAKNVAIDEYVSGVAGRKN